MRNHVRIGHLQRDMSRRRRARNRTERLQRLADSGIDTWEEYHDYESFSDRVSRFDDDRDIHDEQLGQK